MRRDFTVQVFSSEIFGYILELEECLWIWVGNGNIAGLSLSFYPRSTMLTNVGDSYNIHVKSLSTRISRIFKDKQVFFSTDLDSEEPQFWNELFLVLTSELEKVTLTGKMAALKVAA